MAMQHLPPRACAPLPAGKPEGVVALFAYYAGQHAWSTMEVQIREQGLVSQSVNRGELFLRLAYATADSCGAEVAYDHAWVTAGRFGLQISFRAQPLLAVRSIALRRERYADWLDIEPPAVRRGQAASGESQCCAGRPAAALPGAAIRYGACGSRAGLSCRVPVVVGLCRSGRPVQPGGARLGRTGSASHGGLLCAGPLMLASSHEGGA